jgi:hypothetical protein
VAKKPTQHHTVPEIHEHLKALRNHLQVQANTNSPITPASLAELSDIISWVQDYIEHPPERD